MLTPRSVYRSFETDGVPSSGPHDPKKDEIIQLLELIQSTGGQSVVKNTLAQLNATTLPAETYGGIVLSGSGAGYYSRAGATWVFGRSFPDTFAKVLLSGSGAAQTGAVSTGVNPASIEVFFAKVATANTGPLTLSISGGPPRPVVNLAGNPLSAGEWTGMVMFYLNDANQYQLLIDAGAAASAAASAGAAAANATRAEAAADAALAAVTGIIAPKATVADAMADAPSVDPAYYDIAYFDVTYQAGSGAKWKKVSANPGLVGRAAFQNQNGAWYVNDAATMRPEMFGRVGMNAAGDTAAWVALASVANSRPKASIAAEGVYLVAGSTVLFSGGTLKRLSIRLLNAEFYQQSNFSKTFRFEGISEVRVHGGYGEGRGGGAGEYNGVSSSYNGVAFMHFLNCDSVWVSGTSERFHAGGGFVVMGGRLRKFENVTCEGIGFPFIDPIGQANQGNGSDFGIMCQPSVNNETQLFKFEDSFINCRVFNHAFGIQTVATKSLFVAGCNVGPCPGQHGFYLINCDGINFQQNNVHGTRQFGVKQQYENYAGRFIGPVWAASTAYIVGNTVRAFGTLYLCKTAHTSGASFSATNWDIHPLMFRNGGVVSNNFFDGEDQAQSQAMGWISTPESDARYIFSKNLIISGNTITRFDGDPIKLDRCLDTDVLNNMIFGGRYGLFLTDYRGRIKGNAFRSTQRSACYVATSGDVWYEDNLHIDCAMLGVAADNQTPSLVTFVRTAGTTIPSMPVINFVNYNRNEIRYTQGTVGLYILFGADPNTNWRVTETRANTSTAQKGRVDGSVLEQFRNDFATWFNAAQNESVPTDAATLITNLRAKRVVK